MAQREDTGEWFCGACAVKAILKDRARGEPVTVSLAHRGVSDVMVVPPDKHILFDEGHLLIPLAEAVHISFCRN